MVARRDYVVRNFTPVPYLSIMADLAKETVPFTARWKPGPDQKGLDEDGRLLIDLDVGRALVERLSKENTATVLSAETKRRKANPPKAYSLADIQIEASKRFGMTAENTLKVCQSLYEVRKITSYPRTDCGYLPESQHADAPAVLLTLTEKVGGQTVTLRVYELDEDGYARYALFGADGTEIDIPFGVGRRTWIGEDEAAEKVSLTVRDDVLGFPGFELETVQGGRMTVRYFYALTEQGFVYAGEAFGLGFDDTEWGDGVWPLDLTGDGRSELVTRSTFGTGVPYVFVYRWNAAEGISQHSGIVWEKADAQLAKLSAPLGSVARAETYHAEDNTVTLTLYTEGGTREVTLPLTTDILGEWHAND